MRQLATLMVLLVPASAHADIPSPPMPVFGAPAPRKVRTEEGERWRSLPQRSIVWASDEPPLDPDEDDVVRDPDVAVVRRDVSIDVLFSLARVRERTVLRSDRPVRGFVMGFAQSVGRVSGIEIYDLHARVDGRELEVERYTDHRGAVEPDGPPEERGARTRWLRELARVGDESWEWTLDVDGEVVVETSYLVPLVLYPYDGEGQIWSGLEEERTPTHHVTELPYDLRAARAWRDGRGRTSVRISTHGGLEITASSPEQETTGNVSLLRPDDATAQVSVDLAIDAARVRRACASYPRGQSSHWVALVDRVHLAQSCRPFTPEQAEALVADLLRAARGRREPDRRVARELLAGIADNVRRSPPPLEDPDEGEEEAPEWLLEEGEQPEDPILSLDLAWPRERAAAARWIDPWTTREEEEMDERAASGEGQGKRPAARFREEDPEPSPPPPRHLASELSFTPMARWADYGAGSPFVTAARQRRRAPALTFLLTLGLLLPFGAGYVWWRIR